MKIYAQGPLSAEVAFVGDAVISYDLKSGLPFSGRDGDNLKTRISLLGKSPTSFYWTYFVKDRITANVAVKFNSVKGKRYKEATTTDLYEAYEQELFTELSTLPNLKVIFAVGEAAMFACCRQMDINKRRGSIYDYIDNPNVKVVPLIHPRDWMISFINGERKFGNYIYSQYTYFDLKKVFDVLSKGETLEVAEYDIQLKPTFDQAIAYLDKCLMENIVSFDIETSSKLRLVTCISFACKDMTGISIPFKDMDRNYYSLKQEIEIWRKINKVLSNPGIIKVGQYVIYDATYVWRVYGIEVNNMEDTMIGFKLLFPDFSVSLATICSICTKQPYYKDTGKDHIKNNTTDLSFWLYNALDSLVTLEAWFIIKQSLQQREMWHTYTYQRDLIKPLIYMGENGLAVDVANLHKYSTDLRNEANELHDKLNKMYQEVYFKKYGKKPGKDTINPNSSKDMIEYFYVIKGYEPYVKRATKGVKGGVTCDKTALKRLARKGAIEAKWVAQIRANLKMISTYAECDLDTDNRFRYSYNPVGTAGGRLSSQKTFFGTGTNSQNLPEGFKHYLKADDNTLIYNLDLSKAENRVVAYLAPDPNMINAFESGIDLHSQTAALMFGLTTKEVERQANAKPKILCDVGDGSKTFRDWGKRANHGLNYGLGYKRFALDNELPEKESKTIIEKYYRIYPGVEKYHSWVTQQLRSDRTLINCFGRRRAFYEFFDHSLIKEGYSYIPQSTIADVINQWGILFIWNNKQSFPGLKLIQQVHDSIVFSISLDIPISKHVNYIKMIQASLEQDIAWRDITFNIPVDCEFGRFLKPMDKVNLNMDTKEIANVIEQYVR